MMEHTYDINCTHRFIPVHNVVARPSFPMMTITYSMMMMMMMMMSCLVDPMGAEVANSGLQHSSTFGAWVCRAG